MTRRAAASSCKLGGWTYARIMEKATCAGFAWVCHARTSQNIFLKIRVALSRQLSDPEMMSKYLFEPSTRCFDFALGGSHSLPAGVPMAMTPTPRHPPRPYHLQSDGRRHCAAGCCGDAVTSRLGMSSMRPAPHFGANGLGTADASYLAAVASPVGPNWPYIIIYCHITLNASSELMYSKLSLSLSLLFSGCDGEQTGIQPYSLHQSVRTLTKMVPFFVWKSRQRWRLFHFWDHQSEATVESTESPLGVH